MSLRAVGSVLHLVPLQQCALVSNIAGNACNTMKQRGAVRLGNTAPCFMELFYFFQTFDGFNDLIVSFHMNSSIFCLISEGNLFTLPHNKKIINWYIENYDMSSCKFSLIGKHSYFYL